MSLSRKIRPTFHNTSDRVLILGGGPAGLGAAWHLEKAGIACAIVEKNRSLGGLSRTLRYGDFYTDIGPHRFYSQDQNLNTMIMRLLAKDLLVVDRLTHFYIQGKFFLYPIVFRDALKKLGLTTGVRIVSDYLWEQMRHKFSPVHHANFEQKAIAQFGRSLAELNMLNYTEKIWGMPCAKISADWFTQRIRGLSLGEVFWQALRGTEGKKKNKTLADRFFYPRWGAGFLYERIRTEIKSSAPYIYLQSHPVKVTWRKSKILKVFVQQEEGVSSWQPRYLISSIPVTQLIELLDPPPPRAILEASHRLHFRSHLSLFITVNQPSLFLDQWLYFPDQQIPFGRISEPKNFSKNMAPLNRTSLLVEFFCWYKDALWNASSDTLLRLALPWLTTMKFLSKKDIQSHYLHKEQYAYPVYDLVYQKSLRIVQNFLKNFPRLILTGRNGLFRYNNQDHALKMGFLAAQRVITGKPSDILEGLGSHEQYLERGVAPSKIPFTNTMESKNKFSG